MERLFSFPVARRFLAVILGFSYSLSVIPTGVADFFRVRAARTSATERRDHGNTSTHSQPLRSSRLVWSAVALPPLLRAKLNKPISDTTNPTPAHCVRPKQILIHCINTLRERTSVVGVHSLKSGNQESTSPVDSNLVREDSWSDSCTGQEFQGVNHAETNKLRVVHRGNRSVGCDVDFARERGRSKSIRSETAK